MMIMSEPQRDDTHPPANAPAGATIGALPRSAERESRERIARRIEASARETEHRSAAHRLAFTFGAVALFGFLTWVLQFAADTSPGPLSPMLIAIGLATWYGGIRQGLLATALSLLIAYALIEPAQAFHRPDAHENVHGLGLLIVAPGVALVSDALRGSVVHSSDLAETRRRLLAAVFASEERWRHFNESVPALMSETTSDGAMTYCNPQWMLYTGMSFEEIRDNPLRCAHPDDRTRVAEEWRRAISTSTPLEIEWRVRRSDGAYRWHYGIAIPSFDTNGRRPVWISVNVDIDDRKRAQAEAVLHRAMRDESETRARLAMLAAHLESWVCDIEGGHITIMRREVSRAQRPTERWERWVAHVHPQDRAAIEAAVHDVIALQGELDIDFRMMERNRSVRWMHVWGRAIYGSAGEPRQLIAVQQDVTDRKRAEETAREGEEHLRRLADANIIGVASGVGDLITEANDTFLRTVGYTRADLAEHRLRWQTLTPRGEERVDGDIFAELLRRGASEPRQRDYVTKDGQRRHVLVGTLLLDRKPFRWVRFGIDLTDQVNAEEAMHNALKSAEDANAAKDEFVALVAHELRGPITTIVGNAEILEKRSALIDAPSRAAALSDIRAEADRLRRMIQDLLVLARLERHAEMEPEPLRIERIVQDVITRHRRAHPERPVEVSMPEPPPLVLASQAYTDQVISNLLTNAEKYSPAASPVEVAIDAPDRELRVRVLDQGAGIAPDEIEQVFRPFYRSRSTAGRAEGFGIGLTVCRRLVEAQGGTIWARPRAGGGTEFGFTLPVAGDGDTGTE
jgi:PAS domain S-box-containing protein